MSESTPEPFEFPKHHSWPPFYTIQPVLNTRLPQFRVWSKIIVSYCRAHKIWRLKISDHLSSPLFHNSKIGYSLALKDAKTIVDWMTTEEGGRQAEWVSEAAVAGEPANQTTAWIFWRRPEEWAEVIMDWIEATGQKGSVVTLYEITQGETSTSQEFHGMDLELLQKTLQVLVKRGKAQVFGAAEEQGVKFF